MESLLKLWGSDDSWEDDEVRGDWALGVGLGGTESREWWQFTWEVGH